MQSKVREPVAVMLSKVAELREQIRKVAVASTPPSSAETSHICQQIDILTAAVERLAAETK